ncbi:AsmA family protein [Roseomonas sp. NAR14]|uniref:AsmA family protein n=1 Tax=Roseomonas acroporae TaxID=2937791 RepID=A0A9X1Y688_9PROT|nr:AsmA family protein [Roseomonas acroporae]MCK8784248.1 AsmA family protein [Roseomonas acroporae]
MKRRILWLAGLVVLLAPPAGLGLALALLDPNDHKPQLAAAVEEATGRAFELRGPVRIGRSLWPTVELVDVRLANLPGGSRPDMVRAERVEARLSLPALLRRRLQVDRLTLIGPNILLEYVNGRPNWVFGAATAADAAGDARRDGGTGATSPAGPAVAVRVAEALVRNGMVTLRLPRRTHVVGIRSLAFLRPIEGGPVELATELVYQDNKPFLLRADATPTGSVTDPWDARLTLDAFDARVAAAGRVRLAGPFDLRVEGTAPDLARLNALWPAMRLPALRKLDFATHLASGREPGDLPVIGETRLRFEGGDLGDRVPGLRLGALSLSLPQAGGTATVEGSGRYEERGFSLAGTVGVPARLDERTAAPFVMRARATPTRGRPAGEPAREAASGAASGVANGVANGVDGSLLLDGRLALRDARFDGLDAAIRLNLPDLAAWQPLLPAVLPPLTGLALDGRVVLPADLATARLRDAALTARQVEATGEATLGLGTRLALTGRLRASRLDLDALLAGAAAAVSPRAAATGPLIPDTPLPWRWVQGRTVDLAARVGALTLNQQVWRDVELALEVAENRLQLAQLRLAMPDGPAELSLSADAGGGAATAAVPVSLSLRAAGIPLGLVTRTLRLPGEAAGMVRLDARLRAEGRSARDLAATLDGPFSATMLAGRLSNAALTRIAAAPLEALGIEVPAAGETAIRCLGLIGDFHRGVGRMRVMALDSTYLRLRGAGQVDLGGESLEIALRPLAQVAGSPVEVPVVVSGPFRRIQGRLDADGFDRLGLLISGLLGGDRPDICGEPGLLPARPASDR